MRRFDPTKKLCKLRKYISGYIADYINLVTSDKPCLCKKCGRIGPKHNVCTPEPMDGVDFKTPEVNIETGSN